MSNSMEVPGKWCSACADEAVPPGSEPWEYEIIKHNRKLISFPAAGKEGKSSEPLWLCSHCDGLTVQLITNRSS